MKYCTLVSQASNRCLSKAGKAGTGVPEMERS